MLLLELFNFMHFIGLSFGLGGATIAAVISAKSERDREIASVFGKIIPSISRFIWCGLFLLLVSGIALPFYIKWPINKQLLIIKHVLVVWIVIIGITVGYKVKRLNQIGKPKGKLASEFLKTKKQIKGFSIINLVLWYAVTLLSAFV